MLTTSKYIMYGSSTRCTFQKPVERAKLHQRKRARDQCCIVPMVQLGSRLDARHADGAVLPHTGARTAQVILSPRASRKILEVANRCPASQAGTRVDPGTSGTSGAIALIVLLK